MKKLLLLVPFLAACTSQQPVPVAFNEIREAHSVTEDHQFVPVPIEVTTPLLSNKSYADRGEDTWFEHIGAVKIQGFSEAAALNLRMDRTTTSGFSGLGLYVAFLNEDGLIESEWKNTRYIEDSWIGNCKRNLAPSETAFTTLGKQTAETTIFLKYVPVSNEDPCVPTVEMIDLTTGLKNGIVIGFLPSDSSTLVSASISHDGGLQIEPFRR